MVPRTEVHFLSADLPVKKAVEEVLDDTVLAPLGGKRLMDFDEVIGYGTAGASF
jgi:hypothetical protein